MIAQELELQSDLERLAAEEDIQLMPERIREAINNYQIANWQRYENKPMLILLYDSLKYGNEQGIRYFQEVAINIDESDYQISRRIEIAYTDNVVQIPVKVIE